VKKIVILISIYDDWKSAFKLLSLIDLQIVNWNHEVSVLVINDASKESKPETTLNFKNIKSVKVLNMKENRGHARCYATGLKFLCEKDDFDYFVLMDGDGEDRPEELNLLFQKSKENPSIVVTADRISRSEGLLFRFMYIGHKVFTYFFTGKFIKFGNYSFLPKEIVFRLVKEACIWSSFSGSLTKIAPNRVSIRSIRGQRYFGPSKMNLFNLFIHSFSIIAVFRRAVIVRSALFIIFYLFFVYNNLSIITLFPVFAILVFLFLIFKVSSRENIEELNKSLENIASVDVLGDFNSR